MWPNQRTPENLNELDEEEEVKAIDSDLPVVQSPPYDPTKSAVEIINDKRASVSSAAAQGRTSVVGPGDDLEDPELTPVHVTNSGLTRREQAMAIKKAKEDEKRRQEEERKRQKKIEAKKRREKAKKATGKKKKKKKVWKPDEIEVGDVVLVAKGIAVTRWKGVLHFRPNDGLWLGVEFVDGPFGKNDGKVQGKRYFKAKKANHGSFVKQITRKLRPEDLLRKLGTVQSELKNRQDALEASHQAILELQEREKEEVAKSPELSNLKTPMARLNLLDQLSGNLEKYATDTPEDVMINMQEEDSSSYEEYFSSDDDDLPSPDTPLDEEEYQRMKKERKNLLLASQTDLYREGSLREMQNQMQEHMDRLKVADQEKAKGKLVKQPTVSSMGLVLPEKDATPEEVAGWIKQNLSKVPGHPDLEDQNVLKSLTWTLGLFLKVQDNFSF